MENQLLASLGRNKLLKNVDISKIDLTKVRGRLITISEGEILYREGDYADQIFLVVSGEVNVLKKRLLGKTKSFIFNEGDFFGQEEFIEEMSRTSTSVALRDTYLISLTKEEIDELLRQDSNIMLNLREPSNEMVDEELASKKTEIVEESKTVKAALSSINIKSQEEFNELQKTNLNDHAQTHEFFQSISDSSRFEEDNLVQPLDRLKETKEEKRKTSDFLFGADIYNKDGIIKSEFELPETEKAPAPEAPVFTPEPVTNPIEQTLPASDLNDALFNMLSGSSAPASVPEETKEKSLFGEQFQQEEDNYFAAMNLGQDIKNEPPKKEFQFEPKQEDIMFEPEPLPNTSFEPELPKPLPPYKPATRDTAEIEAEADAVISAITQNKINTSAFSPAQKTETPSSADSKSMSNDELQMIIKAAQLVNSGIKIEEVLQNIVDVAIDLTNADRGTLYLIDYEKKELTSMVAVGNEIREIRLKIGEGLAGYVAKSGETINIKDVQTDPRFNREIDKASGYTTKSMICFPIKNNKEKIIGVLQLLNSKNGFFTNRDEVFLQAISIHSAIALQNADLVEKLLTAERVHSLGKMANFLIQDIKKPVLVSKRYAEHLLNIDLPKETLQIFHMLLEQLIHVAEIIQTTSSYSEGKTILRLSNLSLNKTLTDYASRVDTYVSSRSCRIIGEFEKDTMVKLDVKEFFQCYMNIVKNACDAMPEGGTIFVSTKHDGKNVKILIKDSGLGIPEGYKDKIFEPFMSYGKKEGTGLGLAITRKIVEEHNATIDVESTTGAGATFIITLPTASMY